jgi:hypothetical protein
VHLERHFEKGGSCVGIMALVFRAEEWARYRGALDIVVASHRRRLRAHRFYRGMAYEETGHRFYKPLEL